MHWVEGQVVGAAAPNTERRDFAHVNPDAAPANLVVVRLHPISPPRHGLLSVPIGEDGVTGPHLTNIFGAVWIEQKYASLVAICVDSGMGRSATFQHVTATSAYE